MDSVRLASVASFSVWFRSKERPWNGIFGFGRARNGTRAKKGKRRGGEGEGEGRKTPHRSHTRAIFRVVFDSRSLVLCSGTALKRLLRRLWYGVSRTVGLQFVYKN